MSRMIDPMWMRNEVLTKFGKTVANKWRLRPSAQNPFTDPMRDDGETLPIKERIRYWKLARGDRVKVVRGEHKGQEGIIKAIDYTRNTVVVSGVNFNLTKIPKNTRIAGDPPVTSVQGVVNYSDLRLVYELPREYRKKWAMMSKDPLTTDAGSHPKQKWRVVIDKLEISKPFIDKKSGNATFKRLIPGLNVVVPWPKQTRAFEPETPEVLEKQKKDPAKYPNTPSEIVAKKTFNSASLVYPPIPLGVELELHNRYSEYKKKKIAMAKAQLEEWRRRNVPGVKEQEETIKEIQEKDLNVYTSKQLRIRAANKLVRKARRQYFKRKALTDEDVLLLAKYIQIRLKEKLESLMKETKTVEPLTPLEQNMSPRKRIAHRRKRAVLEKHALLERKAAAELRAKRKVDAVKENRGRYKVFKFTPSVKPPMRKKRKGKARKKMMNVD